MPQKGKLIRNIVILLVVAALIIPAAVLLFQNDTNLTGSAITQQIDEGDESSAPADESSDSGDADSSESGESDEGDEQESDESDSEESDDAESDDSETGDADDPSSDQPPAPATSRPQTRTQTDPDPTEPADEVDDSEADADTDAEDESADESETGGDTEDADATDAPSDDEGEPDDETSATSTPSDDNEDAVDEEQPESTEAVSDSGDNAEDDNTSAPEATDEAAATPTPAAETTDEPDTAPAPQPEATDEATVTPTPAPESTDEPNAEITPEVEVTEPVINPEATAELTPEVTAEVDLEATAEVTPELTPELTPEVTPEITPEVIQLDVAQSCTASGVEFSISSSGDMTAAETYSIDGETAGEFLLSTGESLTVSAGFGQPIFSAAGMTAQPDEPCEQPPVIEITSAVCVPETGFVVALTNSGGPMTEAHAYTINDEPAGEFLLDAGATTEIELGFGSPVFASDELSVTPETACEPSGSVGGSIWLDFNGDGIFDEDENGLADLTVTLSNADGSVALETITAEDGSYRFEHLLTGDYTLQITNPPTGVLPTVDPDGGQDSSAVITISADPLIADFAYEPLGSISGVIWSDLNADGVQTDDEPGLPGISLTLTDSDDNAVTIESDDTGAYAFADLRTGDYTVSLDTPPDGSLLVQPDSESLSITLTPDEDASVSFGYQPLGSISGVVWADLNSDGSQTEGEPGLSGVSVSLIDGEGTATMITTGETGSYTFADVRAGEYTIRVDAASVPEGYTYVVDEAEASASTSLTLDAGVEASASFGYLPRALGSISGGVWADLDGDGSRAETEPGLGGITVTLSLPDGDIQTTTAASGAYRFDNLEPGDYVTRIPAETLGDSLAVTGEADGVPDGMILMTVEESPLEAINFGLQPAALGSISGMIWLETGDFGVRNDGETGLAGATVQLIDSTGAILQTATVRADGLYTFAELLPGTYTVSLDPASLPDPIFVTVDPDDSGDFSTTITLPAGGVISDVEFGLVGTF